MSIFSWEPWSQCYYFNIPFSKMPHFLFVHSGFTSLMIKELGIYVSGFNLQLPGYCCSFANKQTNKHCQYTFSTVAFDIYLHQSFHSWVLFKPFGLFPLGQLALWLPRHLSTEMPVIILHYFCLKLITLQSLNSQFFEPHTCNNVFLATFWE